MTGPSRFVRSIAQYILIAVVVISVWVLMFAAVSYLPPEPTPESVEMGGPR